MLIIPTDLPPRLTGLSMSEIPVLPYLKRHTVTIVVYTLTNMKQKSLRRRLPEKYIALVLAMRHEAMSPFNWTIWLVFRCWYPSVKSVRRKKTAI